MGKSIFRNRFERKANKPVDYSVSPCISSVSDLSGNLSERLRKRDWHVNKKSAISTSDCGLRNINYSGEL
ncbi:hypothetical protein [Lactobacillus sp. ESL0677]|uniref:hypothetical protein n=1 Tax=Lactobacillus sp. ESL0677 TaxID=2983208 RepID=UPI0023F7C955|nr:hypothetical protein [Lactobacillus sp. ESL0677]WEV36250.1 hypothetical protein OZX76_05750 [Lactobacillus sp. ESL0677]